MAKGKSKAGGGSGGGKPKSQLDMQIENLEQSVWGGSGKAMSPSVVKVGDRIDGIQYEFRPDELRPVQKKSAWSGEYAGSPTKFKADDTFKVTSVTSNGDFTIITGTKLGGAGGTVKKKLPNNIYLRVFRG